MLDLTYQIGVDTDGAQPKLEALDRSFQQNDASSRALTDALKKQAVAAKEAGERAAFLAKNEAAAAEANRRQAETAKAAAEADARLAAKLREADAAVTEYERGVKKLGQTKDVAVAKSNSLIASFGRLISVAAIGGAIHKTIQYADAVQDMAEQTGIGTNALQRLQFTASQSGVKMDTVTSAIRRLQDGVGGGNKGIAKTIQALGLSLEDLRKKKPEELFQIIAQRVASIEDPTKRAAIAIDLFGRNGPMKVLAVAQAMDTVGKSAPVMSEKTIQALGTASDQFDRLKTTAMTLLAQGLTPVLEWFNQLPQGAQAATLALTSMAALGVPAINTLVTAVQSLRVALVSLATTPAGAILLGLAGGAAMAAVLSRQAIAQAQGSITPPGNPIDPKKISVDDPRLQGLKPPTGPITIGREALGLSLDQILQNRLTSFQSDYNFMLSAAQKSAISTYRDVASASELSELTGAPELAVKRYIDLLAATTAATKAAAREAKRADAFQQKVRDDLARIESTFLPIGRVGAYLDPRAYFQAPTGTNFAPASGSFGTVGGGIDQGALYTAAMTPAINGDLLRQQADRRTQSAIGGGGLFAGFGSMIQTQLPQVVLSAVTGGGSLLQGVGSLIGSQIGSNVAGSLAKTAFGASGVGKLIGNFLPGIGALAGPLLGALGGLFGPSKTQKEGRAATAEMEQLKKSLLDQYGSLDKISRISKAVGVDLAGAFGMDAKGVVGLAHLKELAEQFQERMQRLDELTQKYGLTWADLGEAAKDLKIGEATDSIIQDLKDLQSFGVSSETALLKVRDAMVDVATKSIRAGRDIPPALAPYLKQLAEAKQLTEDQVSALLGLKQEGQVDWKAMEEAAGKYGIKLDALGPKFAAAKIHDKAIEILGDYNLLIDGGANVESVLKGMAGSFSKLVQDAKKSGVELPDTMKPILQKLVDMGLLTDENGTKLKDLSGIKFAKPLEQSIGDLIKKLDELILKLGGVTGAAGTAAAAVGAIGNTNPGGGYQPPVIPGAPIPGGGGAQYPQVGPRPSGYPKNWPWPPVGAPGGPPSGTQLPPPQFALGGLVKAFSGRPVTMRPMGTDTVPAMLTPGEFVIPKSIVDRMGVGFFKALTGSSRATVRDGMTFAYGGGSIGTPGVSLYPTNGYNWPGGIGLPTVPTPYPAPAPPPSGGGVVLPKPVPVPVPVPVPTPAPIPAPRPGHIGRISRNTPQGPDPNRLPNEGRERGPGGSVTVNVYAMDAKDVARWTKNPANRRAIGAAAMASARLDGDVRNQARTVIRTLSK